MKTFLKTFTLGLLLSFFLPRVSPGEGEPGNNNPTGVTGEYNGSITTGGSYDPYTGNAKRFIDDLTVTGSVGAYPLKWTRVLNTRGTSGPFGNGGGWKHSYQWGLSILPPSPQCGPELPGAIVSYPDGRKMTFRRETQPPRYEDDSGAEPGDRLVQIGTSTDYDFKLKDGGRVEFRTVYGWAHFPKYIVDPYGQRTTLDYTNNSPNAPTLWKITEPAGRYLKITYKTYLPEPPAFPGSVEVIDYVEAYDGPQNHLIETVHYDYERVNASGVIYVRFYDLIRARYDDGQQGVYEYFAPALVNPGNPWTLAAGNVKTCDDVRFAGAMSKIEYEYVPADNTPVNPVARGQIRAERNKTTHQVISSVNYPQMAPNSFTRTETRADGATRKFKYFDYSFELESYTDFAYPGQPYHTTTFSYPPGAPGNHYYRAVRDARPQGYTTKIEKDLNIGAVMAVIHPNGSRSQYHYTDDNNPYYVDSKTDENNKTTYYDRLSSTDPSNPNRVWQIRYPDGGYEQFTYNNFGQVLTHRMTSGGTETFTYSPRGLKETYTPPGTLSDPNPADHPTMYFYYDASNSPGHRIDRLYYALDPLLHATFYDYNQRGQVTRMTHHDTTFTHNEYYADGTLHISTDELGHATTYTYDEYKRVLSVENAVHKIATSSYDPDPSPSVDRSLTHTTTSVYQTTSPAGKTVRNQYDANFRLIQTTQAPATGDEAITTFTYDGVGNQITVTRPNGQPSEPIPAHTTTAYDDRNRRISLSDEWGHATAWEYDDVGNMKKETRADTKYRTWDEYDAMNRVKRTTGFLHEPTNYEYDLAGNLRKTIDFKNAVYENVYDNLNRKQSASYPLSGSASESWRYDAAGNLRLYKNTAYQYKHFEYDNRNRQTHSYWNTSETGSNVDTSVGAETVTVFDPASRVTSVASGPTVVAYGYDDANRKIWEDQTLSGSTRRVETLPDDDGNRATLTVAGAYALTYGYTQRQQLWHINKTGAGQFFEYTYDKNGNLKKRQNTLQGGDSTIFTYDRADRVTLCTQTGANDAAFARSDYNDYDLVDNLKSVTREEDGNKGERFTYDDANQLNTVSYKADITPHGPEQPGSVPGEGGAIVTVSEDSEQKALAELVADPDREPLAERGGGVAGEIDAMSGPRTVTYVNDPLNRVSMEDSGVVTNYTPNGLNQYTAVSGHTAPLYDTKFSLSGYDGWTYIYDADKRLISASSAAGGGHSAQFVYDGLGRCVKRTIDGVSTVFTYDEWKTIVEWSDAGAFVAWNLYGSGADEILVRYQPNTGGYVHYHLDAMGNVQFLLSGELNLGLEKYTYDAFGQPRITGWNGDVRTISRYGNRFMFTGREYLYTLGIYDYRHRLYHPGLGRFIQTDPIGFDGDPMNLYRYCGSNPILHSDPTGLLDQDGNNKSLLTSFGGGDWVTGSDGLTDRDRHDHTSMGSNQAGSEQPQSIETRSTPIPNPKTKAYAEVVWGDETPVDAGMSREQIIAKYGGDGAVTTANYPPPQETTYNGRPKVIQSVTATKHLPNNVSPKEYTRLNNIETKSVKCIRDSVGTATFIMQNKVRTMSDANAVRNMVKQSIESVMINATFECKVRADVHGGNARP